ncbi:serine/threonine-protein kinase AtPK2/AtPK19-like isoform X2 [Telopea speciosissima]|uniref:serine/threonine-protein kinase AtPK2/AtPK19-like isoform X2 n=1 Tax=Telopea speciosissima TaxID=54955 RepID=UPI001CC76E48|nr:serine/threonine-protein kinase AtPK2/AtPK19-like isoform X2 [Telopea speciosissima]
MVSSAQKKTIQSILAAKLGKLSIPPSVSTPGEDFDFSDVFGPQATHAASSSSSPSPFLEIGEPEVIHSRSHSFLGPSPRLATSRSLSFKTFDGENSGSQNSDEQVENEPEKAKKQKEENGMGTGKTGPGDFEILRLVGRGSFGKVFLVRKKNSGGGEIGGDDVIFAMKMMRKDTIIKKNHVDYMKAERDILTKVVHPFIVQLRYSFQTKSKLYLILDFINGGHLFYHLYRQGIFSEDQARVYTAEIVSAVSHLHNNGIVHRDLKPENILMDADGHEMDESTRTNSLCGTTEYMAPEILLRKGHNKEADWWSLGILLYEMLTGQPPFTHANRQKLQQRIISEKMKLPSYLSTEAHSLLKGLLQKEPSRRLGNGPGGEVEIKNHKWFRPINWKKLESRQLEPKFKPDVSGRDCTANFDKCWTSEPPDDSPASTPTTSEHFQGYTYVAPGPWLSG